IQWIDIVISSDSLYNGLRRQLAGAKRIINAFAGKRLNHTRRVADHEQLVVRRRKRDPGERSDCMPGMILWQAKALLRPTAEGRDAGGFAHETQIQFIVIDRSLTRIALAQKLQHDSTAEPR